MQLTLQPHVCIVGNAFWFAFIKMPLTYILRSCPSRQAQPSLAQLHRDRAPMWRSCETALQHCVIQDQTGEGIVCPCVSWQTGTTIAALYFGSHVQARRDLPIAHRSSCVCSSKVIHCLSLPHIQLASSKIDHLSCYRTRSSKQCATALLYNIDCVSKALSHIHYHVMSTTQCVSHVQLCVEKLA